MYYTDDLQLETLVGNLNKALNGDKDILSQISKVREIMKEAFDIIQKVPLDCSLGGKKMKKIPVYEGDLFTLQFFIWAPGVKSLKHAHFGNWGNIMIIDGNISVQEYDLKILDWDKEKFEVLPKNLVEFKAAEVFSLIQNFNAFHSMSNSGTNVAKTLHIYQKKQGGDYFSLKKGKLISK